MKGLFIKDLYNLRQQGKIYLLIVIIWTVLGFANKGGSFLGGFMMILTVLVPITAMAYDDKVKWDRYALTMPVSKMDLVISKYLLALFCAVIGFVLSAIVSIIIVKDISNSLVISMSFFCLGMVVASIILPIMFKFGVEKGRMLMLTVILLPNIIVIALNKMHVSMPSEATIEGLIGYLPIVTILLIVLSVYISKVIYDHKEF